MPKIDIRIAIQDHEMDATASTSNSSETIPATVKVKKEGNIFNLSITADLPEERNPRKVLTLGLFYPAILGYFVFEIFRSLTAINSYPGILPALKDHPSIFICKVILVAGTLCFYCCDFINSMFVKAYELDSLVIDLVIMIVMVVCFNALQISPEDSAQFSPVYFDTCYALFMLAYLIRFSIIRKNKAKEEY